MNLKVKLNFLLAKLGLLFMRGNNKQLKSGKEEGYVLLDNLVLNLDELECGYDINNEKFKDNLDIVPLSINEFIATAEMNSNLEKLLLLKSC